jgi:hypothetical protein
MVTAGFFVSVRRLAAWLLLGVAATLAAACDETLTVPDASTAYIVGMITALQNAPASPRVLVEADSAVDDPGDPRGNKIWLTVTSSTRIMRKRRDGTVLKAALADLRVGVAVAAWTDGLIDLSYPAFAAAAEIVILDTPAFGALWMGSASRRVLAAAQFRAPENTASNTLFHAARAGARLPRRP